MLSMGQHLGTLVHSIVIPKHDWLLILLCSRCSRCCQASYCGATCQKSHWKTHKKQCQCFSVQSLEGKGKGMVASRVINMGELVLEEKAMLVVAQDDEHQKETVLAEQFEKLTKNQQKKVMDLHFEGEGSPLLAVFRTNCIQADSGSSAALFPSIARINHSCAPNVVWGQRTGRPFVKEVRASRRIEEGEEICSNYLDDPETTYCSRSSRQEILQKWGFKCSCSSCSLTGGALQQDDSLRSKCGEEHRRVLEMVRMEDLPGALRVAQAKLNLLTRLGDGLVADLPAAHMEVFEFLAISKALGRQADDPEPHRLEAERLSRLFGDKYLEGFTKKYNNIMHGT